MEAVKIAENYGHVIDNILEKACLYWFNLVSGPVKIIIRKQFLIISTNCCRIGTLLGMKAVISHTICLDYHFFLIHGFTYSKTSL